MIQSKTGVRDVTGLDLAESQHAIELLSLVGQRHALSGETVCGCPLCREIGEFLDGVDFVLRQNAQERAFIQRVMRGRQ